MQRVRGDSRRQRREYQWSQEALAGKRWKNLRLAKPALLLPIHPLTALRRIRKNRAKKPTTFPNAKHPKWEIRYEKTPSLGYDRGYPGGGGAIFVENRPPWARGILKTRASRRQKLRRWTENPDLLSELFREHLEDSKPAYKQRGQLSAGGFGFPRDRRHFFGSRRRARGPGRRGNLRLRGFLQKH